MTHPASLDLTQSRGADLREANLAKATPSREDRDSRGAGDPDLTEENLTTEEVGCIQVPKEESVCEQK